ncbi:MULTISPECIES: carbohydrate kinase family protein [unclassified Microbacterium]|uniref:carbohydrate kinase family protein n=1 Tax=unclassified Microbacterium TaxID=2609290 RepID=UPI0012F93E29|nr:PfkB family carbohydrate kinase [Microbacterium sp. MAH-37]MVQ41091.1 carbohydrate kinase family protein [Microbacterium sp. MAH-37]
MHHISVVGAVSWNTLVLLDELPAPVPHMQYAQDDWQTLGGTSAGKALALAALGDRVRLRAGVGDDAEGERIRMALTGVGIDPSDLVVADRSERHLNLMTLEGERVSLYLASPEALAEADPAALDEFFDGAEVLVVDLSAEGLAALPAAQRSGRPIWVDVHDYDGEAEFHRPFLATADAVFCNADRLADPVAFLRSRVDAGASFAVCTLGAEGAVAVDVAGDVHRVAAVPVEVLDTNGAGDAFLAGVLHAHLDGAVLPEALAAGARSASSVLGTRHLHPLLDDVLG